MFDALGGSSCSSHIFQCTLPGMCGRGAGARGSHGYKTWRLVFRTDQPVCGLSQAELPLTQWHLLFPSLFFGGFVLFCFLVFGVLTKRQVLLAWPCQHHRLGASLPTWIRSKAWFSRSLHKQGLDTCVCTDSAPLPNGLALVSCFLSVRKKFLLFPDALSVFWLIRIGRVVLPLQSRWLGPCMPLIWDWPYASASLLSHHTGLVAHPTAA